MGGIIKRKRQYEKKHAEVCSIEDKKSKYPQEQQVEHLEWLYCCLNETKRIELKAFFMKECLIDLPRDFFDLYDLAYHLRPEKPIDAFLDTNQIKLCGLFELIDQIDLTLTTPSTNKPLYVHGRYFYDPPEVQTVLKDHSEDSYGRHWGYYRDSPDEIPKYVVCSSAYDACSFHLDGTSLFNVLHSQLRLKENTSTSIASQLSTILAKYTSHFSHSSTPLQLKAQRDKETIAPTLNLLGIVVPYDKKRRSGFRELPIAGKALKHIIDNNDKEANRKKLNELITRSTIASDECDFGTGLLLGMELFTGGKGLEKEVLQLLRVAYMLLNRKSFSKILTSHFKHRSRNSKEPINIFET